MPLAQTQPESVLLMQPVYALLFAAVVIAWAWLIEKLDKDAAYFYLPRHWLNLGHLVVGGIAMAAMLLIPWFGLGLTAALALMIGNVVGYAYYRNTQVPAQEQWSFSISEIIEQFKQRQQARAQRRATLALHDADGEVLRVPTGEDPRVVVHEYLEDVFVYALERAAEAVEFAVDGERAGAFVRVDGVRYPYPEGVDAETMHGLIDYVKTAAKLDVEDRRKRQRGRVHVSGEQYGRHEIGLETAGSTRGLTLTALIDPLNRVNLKLQDLGLLDHQLEQVREVLEGPTQRVVIVAGGRRQGISTTLYSFLQTHDPYTRSVVTLEDQALTELEGVHHHQVGEGAAPDKFNSTLASILRADPHVMMLSHLVDERSAKTVVDNAEEVRIYLPLHEENSFAALRSWLKLAGDAQRGAETLAMIVAQCLVRTLCPACRVPYKPDDKALKKFNLPAEKVGELYRASGTIKLKDGKSEEDCPTCHGLGYRGRVGVFEVMAIDDEARKLIAAGENEQLRAHLRKKKMYMLQEAALQKVLKGVTDIKEVTRVLGGDTGASRRGRKPAADAAAKDPAREEPTPEARGA